MIRYGFFRVAASFLYGNLNVLYMAVFCQKHFLGSKKHEIARVIRFQKKYITNFIQVLKWNGPVNINFVFLYFFLTFLLTVEYCVDTTGMMDLSTEISSKVS